MLTERETKMGGRGSSAVRNSNRLGTTQFYDNVSENVVNATNESKQWLHDTFEGMADEYFPKELVLRQTKDLRNRGIAEAYSNSQKIILYREQDYDKAAAVHETTHIITAHIFNPENKPWAKGGKLEYDKARREAYKQAGLTPSKDTDKRLLRPYAATNSSEFWSVLVEEASKGETNKLIRAGMSVLKKRLGGN